MTNDDMSDEVKLQYEFFENLGNKIIGIPEGPFAIYDSEQHTICVIGAAPHEVIHMNLTGNEANQLFLTAQILQASFEVDKKRRVTCKIETHSATADSYALAALRAIVLAMSAQPSKFKVIHNS